MLKGLLLDNLRQMRQESLKYLEELFTHFEAINLPNIGKGYIARFGDSEIHFGKSRPKHAQAIPSSSPPLADHGFQFMLKFLILRGLLLDNLWQLREEGIGYLEEMFSHFNAVKYPNFGNGQSEIYDDFNESSGCLCSYTDSSDCNIFVNSLNCQDCFFYVLPECPKAVDPMLLDPDVFALTEKPFSLKEVGFNDSGKCDGSGESGFVQVIKKRSTVRLSEQVFSQYPPTIHLIV